jgi:hypothetical protein
MNENGTTRDGTEADRRSVRVSLAGIVLGAVAALQVLYGVAAPLLFWGGEPPYAGSSVLLGIVGGVAAIGIARRRRWARVLGVVASLIGIGLVLQVTRMPGMSISSDDGGLLIGLLTTYTSIALVLAVRGSEFPRRESEW